MKNLIILLLTTLLMTTNNVQDQSANLITDLSINHIIKYPASYKTGSEKRYPVMITFHGHGSNERDLIGLSEHFQDDLLWISGRGPVTLREGAYDWYQLPPTPEKIATTLKLINKYIEELKATYPIDSTKIYIMGFSQGSMVSLCYAMAFPNSITGAISQSGAIPQNFGLETDREGLKNKPIMITHGIEDQMMPVERGRQSGDDLSRLGADVTFEEFHMGHSINQESLASVKKWLIKQLYNN